MYDNDHHPADVVGGALLGGGLAVRLQVVSSAWGSRRTASLRSCRLRYSATLLWPLHAPCTPHAPCIMRMHTGALLLCEVPRDF